MFAVRSQFRQPERVWRLLGRLRHKCGCAAVSAVRSVLAQNTAAGILAGSGVLISTSDLGLSLGVPASDDLVPILVNSALRDAAAAKPLVSRVGSDFLVGV